jgi:beta-lactamase regulating signal transducer with metallopeptidase domain
VRDLVQLLAHPAIQPLGWALIHFLWQGSAVAAMLAAALWLLRDGTAHARYLAAYAALLAMAAAPALTLLILGVPSGHTPRPSIRPVITHGSLFVPSSSPSPARATAPSREQPHARRSHQLSFVGYPIAAPFARPERFFPSLVATWLIGVLTLSLRLLGSWIMVQRLPHRHARPISGALAARAEALARRLGIHHPMRLLESTQVQVPLALGWLRAAILVPASAISGMPPAQLEALLAHELSHIRRHDYLVNLLQTAVETVLFYHPAVWWVSHQIRVEREHCCDDLAVLALGDRLTYARALTALETLRNVPAPLALAGSGGHLLARIRRILGLPPERTATAPAWLGGTIMITLLLAATALLHGSAADPPHAPVQNSPVTAARESLPPKPPRVPPLRLIRGAQRLALLRAHQHRAKPRPARRGSTATPRPDLSHPPGAVVGQTPATLHRVSTKLYRVNPEPALPRPAHVRLANTGRKPRVHLANNKPVSGKRPASPGIVQGVPGQRVEDVAVLDLRGVPAKQVAQIQSLKDVGVLVLDASNRGALRASMEDVGATVVAGPDMRVSVEPYLE